MTHKQFRAARYARKINANHDGDYMVKQNLTNVVNKMSEVKLKADELDNLNFKYPDWLEDKISKLSDDVEEVHSYMTSKTNKELLENSND